MPATLADIQRKYGESVYPDYKDQAFEPYMENDSGHGYLGVVLRDREKDLIICNECGAWVKMLGTHLRNCQRYNVTDHSVFNVNDYREKYGIFKKWALCSKSVSKRHREHALKNPHFIKSMANKTAFDGSRKEQRKSSANAHRNMAYKNKHGSCPDQIKARLEKVAKIVGRDVRDNDLRKYDPKLRKMFEYHFGTANKGIVKYGYNPPSKKGEFRVKESSLIEELRRFVTLNIRLPLTRDCSHLLQYSSKTYLKRFGSWRRTKMMAGLDQLLAEVKSAS